MALAANQQTEGNGAARRLFFPKSLPSLINNGPVPRTTPVCGACGKRPTLKHGCSIIQGSISPIQMCSALTCSQLITHKPPSADSLRYFTNWKLDLRRKSSIFPAKDVFSGRRWIMLNILRVILTNDPSRFGNIVSGCLKTRQIHLCDVCRPV